MNQIKLVVLSLMLMVQTIVSPLQVIASTQSIDDNSVVLTEIEQPEAVTPTIVETIDNGQTDEPLEEDTTEEVDTTDEVETTEPNIEENVVQTNELDPVVENTDTNPTQAIQNVKATLMDLKTTVNGIPVPQISEPLNQNTTINMDFVFGVDLVMPKNGDFFTFTLPDTLVDWDNNFKGSQIAMSNAPGFKWETVNNIVTVTLTDVDEVKHSGKAKFAINFISGFEFVEGNDSLEQQLVLPTVSGGEEVYKLTFLPKTSNEKMLQKSATSETATVDNGNRYFEWIVWVNKAGKQLTNATLVDSPSYGHKIDGDITVEKFSVGLSGVSDTSTATSTYSAMNDIRLMGSDAYKITYRTIVTLPIEEQDNKKEFSNTISLTNEGHAPEQVTSKKVSTTYGTSLNKRIKSADNYRSSWEIEFNYNQLALSKDKATLTDTMTGPQKIDLSTLKVYEVNVGADGKWASDANGGKPVTNYTLTPASGITNTFTLQFNDGIDKAYRVVYNAIYEGDFYTGNGQRVTNSVSSGDKKVTPLFTTRNQNVLRKNRTVDYDKQEITWTITMNADNKELKDVTLTDIFTAANGKNGTHTLVGDVEDIMIANGSKENISLVNNDPTQGFVMTGIHVAKGKTATITYKTSYNVEDTGKVDQQGYGNTAKMDWISGSVPYTLSASNHYTPESTTINNGRKWGSFDYITQQLSWNVVVNANKRDITGAVLTDTLGNGHKIMADSFEIYSYKRTGDMTGTEGELLDPKHYAIAINENNTGYTLTFNPQLDSAFNNQAYIVKYKTIDSDNILGIESKQVSTVGDTYTNKASFETKNGTQFNLISIPVKLDPNVANKLLGKTVIGNDSQNRDGILTWTIDVNKSHSTISNVVLSDIPTERILLDKDSIKVRPYIVTASGISEGKEWKKPSDFGFIVETTDDGGFTIDFGTLERKGFQVQYQTHTLQSSNEEGALENAAKLNFDEKDELADNQQSNTSYKNKFAFSKSLAGFSLTKGEMHFEKIGQNIATGELKGLQGAEFALYLKGTDILVRENIVSGEDGYFTIDNLNYGEYTLKEVVAPEGYVATNFNFILDETTDNAQQPFKLVNKKAEVTIQKNWVGNDAMKRPDITIKLYQNGIEYDEKILTNGETTYTWTNLPVSKDGKDYIYTVDEIDTPVNYEKKVEGYTITNTYVIPKTEITATKLWVGGPLQKPAITIQLFRDGHAFGEPITLENGQTAYTWENLDETDYTGKAYKYTVDEIIIPNNYEKTIEGLQITNKYIEPEESKPEDDVEVEPEQPEETVPPTEESKPEDDVEVEPEQPEETVPPTEESKPEDNVEVEPEQPEETVPPTEESKPEDDVEIEQEYLEEDLPVYEGSAQQDDLEIEQDLVEKELPLNKESTPQIELPLSEQSEVKQTLPQTNGKSNYGMMVVGALLLLLSMYTLIRRRQNI